MKRLCLAIVIAAAWPVGHVATQPDLGVAAKDGVVVCTSAPACDAGASVMVKGGNAVDSAVATAFALAVTHPAAGNIGGGGFMIVRTPTGEVTSFDFREKAPLASTRTMYLGKDGNIDRSLTATGYLAPGVPVDPDHVESRERGIDGGDGSEAPLGDTGAAMDVARDELA